MRWPFYVSDCLISLENFLDFSLTEVIGVTSILESNSDIISATPVHNIDIVVINYVGSIKHLEGISCVLAWTIKRGGYDLRLLLDSFKVVLTEVLLFNLFIIFAET